MGLLAVGCKKPATIAKVEGTVTLGGNKLAITGCAVDKYGEPPQTAVIIELENKQRYMSSEAGPRFDHGDGTWSHPTCTRIASESMLGDGWAKGTIGATCEIDGRAFVLDATVDCGVVDRPHHGMKD